MYLIDGHNLVPKIPGMSLQNIDDEERLIELLRVYMRVRGRRDLEVFFDGAQPGYAGERVYGGIRAHFVQVGMTADEAIRRRLVGLGRSARNTTVVTSDRQVQANARAAHATVVSSEAFAHELLQARWEDEQVQADAKAHKPAQVPRSKQPGAKKTPGTNQAGDRPAGKPAGMTTQEYKDWLDLFGIDPDQAENPIQPEESRRPKKRRKT